MKLSIDTKEDSHDELRKVIKLLQNIVGDSQEVLTNQPDVFASDTSSNSSPIANIFGDTSGVSEAAAAQQPLATSTESPAETESTEDLFAELFSEEELRNMDKAKEEEDEAPKSERPSVELY